MRPEDLEKMLERAEQREASWSGAGTKYGIPFEGDVRAIYAAPLEASFVSSGNGATPELLALLLLGSRDRASEFPQVRDGLLSAKQDLVWNGSLVMPSGVQVPSWQDLYPLDDFGRTHLQYWVGRALEAALNAPGSVMGVMATAVCELGKSGQPGQCCNPTDDPFPSKPYFYVVPAGKDAVTVGKDFGRGENGWIELRRANADDPDGFVKQQNKWCYWKKWYAGKRIRIPGSWDESEFTDAVLPHLVDGHGSKLDLRLYFGKANFFFKGIVWRWRTPIHMMVECGRELWRDPAVKPGLEIDPLLAKELIKRTFLAK